MNPHEPSTGNCLTVFRMMELGALILPFLLTVTLLQAGTQTGAMMRDNDDATAARRLWKSAILSRNHHQFTSASHYHTADGYGYDDDDSGVYYGRSELADTAAAAAASAAAHAAAAGPQAAVLPTYDEFIAAGGRLANGSAELKTRPTSLKTDADVKGANMAHTHSTSNPCLSQRPLLRRAFDEPQAAPLSVHGSHRFVFRSGYRAAANQIAATGITLRELPGVDDVKHCFWMSKDGAKVEGTVRPLFPREHHKLTYETVIYLCTLHVETTGEGGGSAYVIVDDEDLLVYSEEPKQVPVLASPRYNLAFCSFPMYRRINAAALREWLQVAYHYLGVEYFVLNDGSSMEDTAMWAVQNFIDANILEIVDTRGGYKYETKHNVWALNDCLYRMKLSAKWVLYLDFDEYLFVEPPHTLKSLMERHKRAAFLSFGSMWWSVDYCRPASTSEDGYLERMKWHWQHFYCVGKYPREKCINYFGHRKFMVQVEKVNAVQVHRTIEPIDRGVDVSTLVAHHNHFQGLLRADLKVCKAEVKDDGPNWWKEDNHIADISKSARLKGKPKKTTKRRY